MIVSDECTTNCLPSSAAVKPGLGRPRATSEPVQFVQGTLIDAVLPLTLSACTPNASDTLGTDALPAGRSTLRLSLAAPQPAEDTRGSPLWKYT